MSKSKENGRYSYITLQDAGVFGKNVRKTQRRNDATVQVEDAKARAGARGRGRKKERNTVVGERGQFEK